MAHGTSSVAVVVAVGLAGLGIQSAVRPVADVPAAAAPRSGVAASHDHRVVIGNGSDPARRVLAVLDPPASAAATPAERVGGLEIRWLRTGTRLRVTVPADASIRDARFTTDGRQLALDVNGPDGLHLWLVDPETGANPLVVSTPLGEGWGTPCDWREEGSEVLCRVEPEQGQQGGGPRPRPGNAVDRAATLPGKEGVQLAFVNRTTGQVSRVGPEGAYEMADLAPGGKFILVGRIGQPAGPSVSSSSDLERVSEIWNRSGKVRWRFLRRERPAPTWDPSRPARLVWVEARPSVGDRVCSLEAPFTSDPALVFEATGRVDRLSWAGNGMLFVREATDRRLVTWAIASGGGAEPKKVWEKEGES